MEQVVLMNMCMVYDHNNNILVLNRVKKDYPGITFPGGHVEDKESIVLSTIREVKEETGLDVWDLTICGIKDWVSEDNVRYLIFLFKTNKFSGTLLDETIEGKVFWIRKEELSNYKLAWDFDNILELFYNNNLSELFYEIENKKWIGKLI